MSSTGVSRRHFFFGSLLAGAVPAAGFGSVPSLRALGYKPFYDKLNVAAIGCGGQGGVILNQVAQTENIVALCDVDEKRALECVLGYMIANDVTSRKMCGAGGQWGA